MTISKFYSDALEAHVKMAQDFKKNPFKFDQRLSKYKTVNQFSGMYNSCTLGKSSKGSIDVKTIFDYKNKTVETFFCIHSNVIFNITYNELEPVYEVVLGGKEWLSQMTKRHLNYIFDSLNRAIEYVTVNKEPFILKDGSLYPLELKRNYFLDLL